MISKEIHRGIHELFLPFPRGKVHVKDQRNNAELVYDREDHQGPVEKDGAARAYRLDDAAVVAQLCYELQEKLIFPCEFLKIDKMHLLQLPRAQRGSL